MHPVTFAHRPSAKNAPSAARRFPHRRLILPTAVLCVGNKEAAPLVGTAEDQHKQAVLCTKFKAHDAAVTALAVLKDEPGFKQIVTASLDKSLAVWTLEGGDLGGPRLQVSRLEVPGGPVFSLARGIKAKVTEVNVKPRDPVLFCGLAAKEIMALRPDTLTFSEQMHMNGHTGWVRSLASSGKYLFSCGCNHLHQWDQAYAVPKEVRSISLFTGDILALAASDKAVFSAGADGSLRRWDLGKRGELTEAVVRDKAHDGRITSLAVSGSLLFSAGYDGDIKAWDMSNLQLVMEATAAHAGERVRALVMGPKPPSSAASSPGTSPGSSPGASPAPSPSPSPSPTPPAAAAAELGPAAQDTEICVEAAVVDQSAQESAPEQQEQQQDAAGAPLQQDEPSEPAPSLPATPAAAASSSSAPGSRASSPSSVAVLYSAGDDGLVRRWDARLLAPVGEPLQVHSSGVKALAVGEREVLVSGDAAGEVAVWLL